jgi:hypothetical protein
MGLLEHWASWRVASLVYEGVWCSLMKMGSWNGVAGADVGPSMSKATRFKTRSGTRALEARGTS